MFNVYMQHKFQKIFFTQNAIFENSIIITVWYELVWFFWLYADQ
jgi:hypothetical protein